MARARCGARHRRFVAQIEVRPPRWGNPHIASKGLAMIRARALIDPTEWIGVHDDLLSDGRTRSVHDRDRVGLPTIATRDTVDDNSGVIGTLNVRRRPLMEQRILAILRGSERLPRPPRRRFALAERVDGLTEAQSTPFGTLRHEARRSGMIVKQVGTPYATIDEMRLLGWMAQAQRAPGQLAGLADATTLSDALVACADILDQVGLRLPITTWIVAEGRDDREGRLLAAPEPAMRSASSDADGGYLPRHVGELNRADAAAGPGDIPRAEAGETVLVVDDERPFACSSPKS